MKSRLQLVLTVTVFVAALSPVHSLLAVPSQSSGDIAYASGGISDDERNEMQAMKNGYTLLLKVAAKSGQYLGDADVAFKRRDGTAVFETRMDGPWLLVNLPSGVYEMSVTSEGTTQRKQVRVGKGSRREVVMYWNINVED
jgi:hypothetical protein